ncbi:MAG TPA: hypothetical protein PLQ81_07085, partial [bacterium]|nr:hypothetical protein [bacterium]
MNPYFIFIISNLIALLVIISFDSFYFSLSSALIFVLILILSKQSYFRINKKMTMLLSSVFIVLAFGYFFEKKNIWYYPGVKLFTIVVVQHLAMNSIKQDELYFIFSGLLYHIPVSSKKKKTAAEILNASYCAVNDILFQNKVKFRFNNNFIESVAVYLTDIENEINDIMRAKENVS